MAKLVQRDLIALSADLENCELMVSRALRNQGDKNASQAAPKSRSKSMVLKDAATIRDRCVTPQVTPIVPIVTGPVSRTLSANASHLRASSMPGKHYFHKELVGKNASVEVTVKSKSTNDTHQKRSLSSIKSTRSDKKSNSESKTEIPKQTNLNYDDAHISVNKQSKSCPSPLHASDKNQTWDQRLKQNKTQVETTQQFPPKELRRTIISNSRHKMHQRSHDNQNLVPSALSRPMEGPRCNSGTSLQSSVAGSNAEAIYRNSRNGDTSVSTIDHLTGSTSIHSAQHDILGNKINKSVPEINPVRILNLLIAELNRKLDTNGLSRSDTEIGQLLSDIENMIGRIPPGTDVTQLLASKNLLHIPKTTAFEESVPVRDTDRVKIQDKKEAASKQQKIEKPRNSASPTKVNVDLTRDKRGFVNTISGLKSNIERMTLKADEYSLTIGELTKLTTELRNENKVIPSLRQTQVKLNERIEFAMRENMKLSTDLQLVTNEKERLASMMSAKDIELSQLKEEIKDIQHFVTDQLALLKPDPSLKVMVEQLDGVVSLLGYRDRDSDDSPMVTDVSGILGKRREETVTKPVTSSPSSSTSSIGVGSSWRKISHISYPPGDDVSFEKVDNSSFRQDDNEDNCSQDAANISILESDTLVPIVGKLRSESLDENSAEQHFTQLHQFLSDNSDLSTNASTKDTARAAQSAKQIADGITHLFADIKQQLSMEFKVPKLPEILHSEKVAGQVPSESSVSSFDSHLLSISQNDFLYRQRVE